MRSRLKLPVMYKGDRLFGLKIKKSDRLYKNNPEEICELRRIKNRLQVIAVLADSDKCSLNPELKAWLELRDKLP